MSSNFARISKHGILRVNKAYLCSQLVTSGVVGTGFIGLAFALNESVKASDLTLHPPSYPWWRNGLFSGLDMKSARRGYEVYKQICAACHSLQYASYRELVNKTHTEEEAKAEAANVMVTDGPDDTGKMFQRPGKLSDRFPSPYPNEEAARAANNGAYPPDLTYIVLARHGGEDYVFSLLTGYTDPPAGVTIGDGQYFNPYFPGGAISMAQSLYNGVVDYEDGTPPTASQLAKDVCNFLKFASEPQYDDRILMFLRVIFYGTAIFATCWYYKRHVWSSLKSRKILFRKQTKD
ncbi:uncharacterized protein B4U80_02441 [Leptotrombidium deliense]|uniref:Cytochrome c domain-containing protein n=1 Tax=Leptotrombidium deliense TaxID=299467 RepID=A0A443SCE8_9ACAR|nr:uncharacterized protein B4U80_02441 [Leptotrombidium deliense]